MTDQQLLEDAQQPDTDMDGWEGGGESGGAGGSAGAPPAAVRAAAGSLGGGDTRPCAEGAVDPGPLSAAAAAWRAGYR